MPIDSVYVRFKIEYFRYIAFLIEFKTYIGCLKLGGNAKEYIYIASMVVLLALMFDLHMV